MPSDRKPTDMDVIRLRRRLRALLTYLEELEPHIEPDPYDDVTYAITDPDRLQREMTRTRRVLHDTQHIVDETP